jgi:hypothetical protein
MIRSIWANCEMNWLYTKDEGTYKEDSWFSYIGTFKKAWFFLVELHVSQMAWDTKLRWSASPAYTCV